LMEEVAHIYLDPEISRVRYMAERSEL
jgi:hypothetical protein